jgi:YHS domain-containing protein
VTTTARIFCILLLAAGLTTSVFATDAPVPTTPARPAAPPALHNQTVCPVMGKPIDSSVYTDIQGQRVYFCCKSCVDKVKADPDKYFKAAAAEGVLFQNIQKTCPISGEALTDHDVYTDFEGRRIYFCCMKCEKSFSADPQKYLKAMDAPVKGEAPKMEMNMDGH